MSDDTKPILVPGQPGDLLGILENALAAVQEAKRANVARTADMEETRRTCEGVAVTTMEALAMWMGVAEVAEMPTGDGQYVRRDDSTGLDS